MATTHEHQERSEDSEIHVTDRAIKLAQLLNAKLEYMIKLRLFGEFFYA